MPEAGIVVVGVGEVRHRPSSVIVRIGVNVTRATVRQATDDAATAARGVIAALVGAGVAEDDVQTAHLAVGPLREHVPNGPPRLVGYTFTNTVSAIVRDLDSSGDVLDAALRAGGEDAVLESVTFAADDPDAGQTADLSARAREIAFADARTKAEHLAQLAGVGLGAPVSIDESGYAPRDAAAPRALAMSVDAGPPLAAGQLTTTVRLRVCFAIV